MILEEIKMDEDSPDYLVHEIFTQNFWKDHPLGKPILGTKETVRRFEQPLVLDYWTRRFSPGNLLVCGRRQLDHDQFAELVSRRFEHLAAVQERLARSPAQGPPRIILRNKKSLEQVQICLGVPSHPITHERRYASYILNTLLGGGMSSRLFQNVRERQGLVLRHLQRTESRIAIPDACRCMPALRGKTRPRWCSRWCKNSTS